MFAFARRSGDRVEGSSILPCIGTVSFEEASLHATGYAFTAFIASWLVCGVIGLNTSAIAG